MVRRIRWNFWYVAQNDTQVNYTKKKLNKIYSKENFKTIFSYFYYILHSRHNNVGEKGLTCSNITIGNTQRYWHILKQSMWRIIEEKKNYKFILSSIGNLSTKHTECSESDRLNFAIK